MLGMKTKKIQESIKVNESWPAAFNDINKGIKNAMRTALLSRGYDIENVPSDYIEVVSNRDPRLRSGATFFRFGPRNIALFIDGQCVVDTEIPVRGWPRASRSSWKDILQYAQDIYHMDFDEDLKNALQQKQADRRASKKGIDTRYSMKNGSYRPTDEFGRELPKYRKIDKSGYVLNPSKYVDMLAASGVDNGEAILDDAKEVYRQLASVAADHLEDPNEYGSMSDSTAYMDTLEYLARTFRELRRNLNDYNQSKAEYGEEGARWSKTSVQAAIKRLREYVNKAKSLLAKEGN